MWRLLVAALLVLPLPGVFAAPACRETDAGPARSRECESASWTSDDPFCAGDGCCETGYVNDTYRRERTIRVDHAAGSAAVVDGNEYAERCSWHGSDENWTRTCTLRGGYSVTLLLSGAVDARASASAGRFDTSDEVPRRGVDYRDCGAWGDSSATGPFELPHPCFWELP